ncbi:MAG: choice-of-anchor D domain-containing protein, partial [Thiomargarita sp.]|nr:choice-of-anchor D domain-containing protein [Thiomargarita sp.]
MLFNKYSKNRSVCKRDINLEEPPNSWWRTCTNWLFDSLMPSVSVSTVGACSLKSPASIWRGVVFVAIVVGMMAMFTSNQVQAAPGPPNVITGLTVNKIGDGTISGNGINCGTDCDEDYVIDTPVALIAFPENGFNFANWTGDCTGTNPNVTVTMDAFFKTCTANFVPAEFIITTIAGDGTPGYSGDGGPAISAKLNHPTGGTIDDIGNLYFSDWDNHAIRKINLNTGIITTFAGGVLGGGFNHPGGYIDSMGNLLYISDYGNHVIYKVNSDGTTTLIAGTIGVAGYQDGPAVDAKFNHPAMLIKDGDNLYIGDFYNHRIRKMDLITNVVETIAGTGEGGYGGDGGSAKNAKLHYPGGLTLVNNNLYIGDYYNHRIRKLDIGSGIITTVAGSNATPLGSNGGGYSGDGGLATDAQLNAPSIAVFDSVGNMYITDQRNHVIRKVDTSGIITTIAGIPNSGGYNGDNILADQAQLNLPLKIIVDSEDNLYIADYGNHRIRKLTKGSNGGCESRFRLYSWPNDPPDFGTELVGRSTSMRHYAYAYTWGDDSNCQNGPTINDISLSGPNVSEFTIENKVCEDEQESFNNLFSRYNYCHFNTVFSPTSEGTKDVTLTATFDNSDTLIQPLLAKALNTGLPQLEISPSSVDFGTLKVGSGSSKTITIKNTGNVNLNISNITVSGDTSDDFSMEWPGCYEGGLKPAEECSLRVSFMPTSAGAKQASFTVTSDNAGSGVITATGTAKDLVDCSYDNITIQTASPDYHTWAVQDNNGNYTKHAPSPNFVWADRNGNSKALVPKEDDVVLIKSGHYIVGIPVLAKVKALCVEEGGALVPSKGWPLEIQATDGISNKGIIGKVEDVNDLSWLGTIPDWAVNADGNDEEPSGGACSDPNSVDTNAQIGSDVILRSGDLIFNEGKIIAGNGGNGSLSGAAGGDAIVRGSNIINKGTVRAGKGGDIYGTSGGIAGEGGSTEVSSNHKHLYNEEFFNQNNVWEKPNIFAGNGGNCTCSNNTGQAGNGGDLRLTAYSLHLDGGEYGSGMAGTGCSTAGSNGNGRVIIDPNVISLANANTKVRGGSVKIFGGKDWILDLRNMSGVVIDATDNVTLAVGENGVIDLRGNSGIIIKAGGIVQLFADIILLDDGVKPPDLIQATDIVLGPNKILHDVSLTGAGKKIGEPEAILPVRLTLANNGPEKDTYTLSVTDTAGWTLGELPSTIEIEGLEFIDLVLDVTLPTSRGATDVITVMATSQANPDVKSVAKVHISVKEMTYTVSGYILDKSGKPVKGITVEIDGKTVVTNEQGHFEIAGLLSGDYMLNVSKDGHNLATKDITLEGDDSVIDIDIEIVAVPTPASCQLYAVNDKGLNNSQFFTVNLVDLTISALGPMYKGHDIEALAIHPETNMIYAASGDNVTNEKQGHFYRVDGETGELFPVGSSGFKEIEDLAFSPDGTLYAWAKGDGLITINLATGVGTLELPYSKPLIEGLTLKKNEDKVFFGAVGTDLWQYDWDTDTLDVICPDKLLGETEALEITPEGLLLIGTHNVPFGLHAFDVETCEVIEADETLSNQYNDVEGIALPVAACSLNLPSCDCDDETPIPDCDDCVKCPVTVSQAVVEALRLLAE